MALSFLGAYITADGERWRLVHVTLGYTMAGLMAWRVVWGLLGPRHVRLSALWGKLRGLPAWVSTVRQGRLPAARPSQNLLMALAVAALMGLVVLTTASGYVLYQDWWGEWVEDLHETLGDGLLAIVLAHIALVLALSVWRQQNQITPMITGRTPGAGMDVVQRNRGWLAGLILAAVLAFWWWQWDTAPAGGQGASVLATPHRHASGHDHEGDDD